MNDYLASLVDSHDASEAPLLPRPFSRFESAPSLRPAIATGESLREVAPENAEWDPAAGSEAGSEGTTRTAVPAMQSEPDLSSASVIPDGLVNQPPQREPALEPPRNRQDFSNHHGEDLPGTGNRRRVEEPREDRLSSLRSRLDELTEWMRRNSDGDGEPFVAAAAGQSATASEVGRPASEATPPAGQPANFENAQDLMFAGPLDVARGVQPGRHRARSDETTSSPLATTDTAANSGSSESAPRSSSEGDGRPPRGDATASASSLLPPATSIEVDSLRRSIEQALADITRNRYAESDDVHERQLAALIDSLQSPVTAPLAAPRIAAESLPDAVDPAKPSVRISIGRIHVQAVPAGGRSRGSAPAAAPSRQHVMSLEEYLSQRSAGRHA